jgi:hypothetical protein
MDAFRPVRELKAGSRSVDGNERRGTSGFGLDTKETGAAHRLNVNFSGEAYDTLVQLAKARGTSMSEVLRAALALEKWLEETRREGGRILVERDGTLREVVWR